MMAQTLFSTEYMEESFSGIKTKDMGKNLNLGDFYVL